MNADTTKQRLREIVTRYRVYWQVWPEFVISRGRREQVGFRLELYGVHPPGCKPTPGCEKCREIYAGLREIVAWIRPPEDRAAAHEVLSFDAALHYGGATQNLASVVLAILILHRGVYDRPVDSCEVRCLREMKEHLQELGVAPDRPPAGRVDAEGAGPSARSKLPTAGGVN